MTQSIKISREFLEDIEEVAQRRKPFFTPKSYWLITSQKQDELNNLLTIITQDELFKNIYITVIYDKDVDILKNKFEQVILLNKHVEFNREDVMVDYNGDDFVHDRVTARIAIKSFK